jgi:hypothetical protein
MARTERELSDAQWAKLVPLLPPQRPRMGRPPKDHRLIVEAIVWLDPEPPLLTWESVCPARAPRFCVEDHSSS